MNLDPEHGFNEEFGDDEGRDGVRTEHQPGPEGCLSDAVFVLDSLHVYEPVEERQAEERDTCGDEDVGAGPEVLVDGKGAVPEFTGGDEDYASEREAVAFGSLRVFRRAHEDRGDRAEERGCDRGQGAQETLRIAGDPVEAAHVDGSQREGADAAIDPGGEIAHGVQQRDIARGNSESGYGNETHEGPVADEERSGNACEGNDFASAETDQSGAEIAERNSCEDAVDANVSEMKVGVGAQKHLDREDDCGAAEEVSGKAESGVASSNTGLKGEDDRHADEEEEAGEDEIGEGPAIPNSVIELRVDVRPVTGIVDENHEGDGDPSEDVDGDDAGRWCGGSGAVWHWVPSSLK
jgi:hypothetical protein